MNRGVTVQDLQASRLEVSALGQENQVLYPIYVHKEKGSVYGASFPDFLGCHAAASTLQQLTAAAQEAVEAHLFGETAPIAPPSSVNDWMQQTEFQDGFWMHVDIDLSTVNASRHSWPTA
ncbi:hypothetical protein D3C71_1548390 [compost metagenome]